LVLALGIFILAAAAFAFAVDSVPEDTVYRVRWLEAFDQIECQRFVDLSLRADCNEQAFLKSAAQYPDKYGTYQGAENTTNGRYETTHWIDKAAATTQEFKEWYKTSIGREPARTVEAKTLLGNFVRVFGLDDLLNEQLTGVPAQKRTMFSLLNVARASFPSEHFESYSTGDLSGKNGGTGWSAAWGTTGGCSTDYDVAADGTTFAGDKSAKLATGNVECYRDFTANTTSGRVLSAHVRLSDTTKGAILNIRQGTQRQMFVYLRDTDQLAAVDDLTTVNYGSWNANQWYRFRVKPNYADETFQVQFDSYGYQAAIHMYDYTGVTHTETSNLGFETQGNPNYTIYWDDISDATFATTSPAVRKATDQPVTSTTTLATDDELIVGVGTSSTYIADSTVVVEASSSVPDLKIRFSAPAGSEMDLGYTGGTTSQGVLSNNETSGTIALDASTETVLRITGTVKTSTTEGSLEFQWAQAVSDSSRVTVKKGSYLRVEGL
jgi:hypothetical protein